MPSNLKVICWCATDARAGGGVESQRIGKRETGTVIGTRRDCVQRKLYTIELISTSSINSLLRYERNESKKVPYRLRRTRSKELGLFVYSALHGPIINCPLEDTTFCHLFTTAQLLWSFQVAVLEMVR